MQEPSPKVKMYVDFTDAIAAGNVEAMRACVSPDFSAHLGKGALNFQEFVNEAERQRSAFPDLGRNVDIVNVAEEGGSLRALYEMTVTFTGRLTDNKGNFIEPTGNKITITAVDHVVFDPEDKILRYTVTSNLLMTLEQMF